VIGESEGLGKPFIYLWRYSSGKSGEMGKAFPKISKAMDGLREAHMGEAERL